MKKRSVPLKVSGTMGALLALSVSLIAFGGCSADRSDDSSAAVSATDASGEDSAIAASKAAAEAEAAEELMSVRKVASKEPIFVVQVGTFKVENNAKSLTESLKKTGLPVFQKKIERPNGDIFYMVRFEPTPSRVEAEKFAATVKSAVGMNALILSVGR